MSIVKGFWNWITNKNKKLADERISICWHCPERRREPFDGIGTCGICGCFLKAKTRDPQENCPHPNGDKWKGL